MKPAFTQRFFDPFAIGYIGGRGIKAFSPRIRHCGPRQPAIGTVPAAVTVFKADDWNSLGQPANFGLRSRAILRVHKLHERA